MNDNNIYKAHYSEGKFGSKFYRGSELLFTVKSETSLFDLKIKQLFFHKGDLIFSFLQNKFKLWWGLGLTILTQNLEKEIFIEEVCGDYNFIIGTKKLSLKWSYNPFSKSICEMYLDGKLIGKTIREIKNWETFYIFYFNENAELEYYFLILFYMDSLYRFSD